MSDPKSRLFVFLSGLVIGLLLGGIIVYYNSVITNQNKISVNLVPGIVKQVLEAVRKNVPFVNSTDSTSNKPVSFNYSVNSQISSEDEVSQDDTSLAFTENPDSTDEIEIIKKDVLLNSRDVEVLNADFFGDKKKENSDSLMAELSGTKSESLKKEKFTITLEYWQNPLNFKGYKVFKNKIALFGIDPEMPLNLYYFKGIYYLKFDQNYYSLSYQDDYASFEKSDRSEITAYLEILKPN